MVRRSVAETAASKERIIQSASRLMRKHGYEGAGIDAIMRGAELTPGAFYKHFSSKADLFAEVVNEALTVAEKNLPSIEIVIDVAAFANFYLSNRAVRDLGAGCLVAALSADLARDNAGAREAAGRYITLIKGRIEVALCANGNETPSNSAWRIVAQLIGGLIVSRILPKADAIEALASVRNLGDFASY